VQTIEVISADKTLTAEQKAQLIRQTIDATERVYQRVLERMDTEGKNWKEGILQMVAVAASIATLVWGVK
jgi:hypothetical protein